MRFTIAAWILFVSSFSVLFAFDAFSRVRAGTFGSPGLLTPDVIWFGTPLVFGAISLILLWQSTRQMDRKWKQVAVVGIQGVAGIVIYLTACWWYIIGTGIDAL